MNNDGTDLFELFLDKISSIVLDSISNEEVMEMVNNELYWGGENLIHHFLLDEEEEEIKEQEELYNEFLKFVDQSYFEELAEIEQIKKEIFMVV